MLDSRTIEIHLQLYNQILIRHKLIYLRFLASGQQFRSKIQIKLLDTWKKL